MLVKLTLEQFNPKMPEWVSHLIYSKFGRNLCSFVLVFTAFLPRRLTIPFWNGSGGLPVDWATPMKACKFGRYQFRLWTPCRADGERIARLMWPNHPSRHPFTGSPIILRTGNSAKREADGVFQGLRLCPACAEASWEKPVRPSPPRCKARSPNSRCSRACDALLPQQTFMRAALDDPPLIQHQHQIHLADCAQPVRHNERRSPAQ